MAGPVDSTAVIRIPMKTPAQIEIADSVFVDEGFLGLYCWITIFFSHLSGRWVMNSHDHANQDDLACGKMLPQ